MPVEAARHWLACEARQMEFAKENGMFWVESNGIKAWAAATAEAIRVILLAAGLSDDWRLYQDDCGEAPASIAD